MILPIALTAAAAAAIVNLWLGIRIGQVRTREKISIGDGGNEALIRRMLALALGCFGALYYCANCARVRDGWQAVRSGGRHLADDGHHTRASALCSLYCTNVFRQNFSDDRGHRNRLISPEYSLKHRRLFSAHVRTSTSDHGQEQTLSFRPMARAWS
jgi:hypothetical protein